MKTLTFFLFVLFSFQTIAAPVLQEVLDDHQYFVTVEWDQKDKSLLEIHNAFTMKRLADGFSSGDFSRRDVLSILESKMSKEEMSELYAQFKTLPESEVANFVLNTSSGPSLKGASWNGTVTVLTIGAVAVSVVALYTIFLHRQLECDGLWDCHGGE